MAVKTIQWIGGLDGHVELIDQTLLPTEHKLLACHDLETIREAICSLRVRGAPAIGIAAAMGVVLGVCPAGDPDELERCFQQASERLGSARPTAVNLRWALQRMRSRLQQLRGQPTEQVKAGLLQEAQAIRDEDAAMCRAIGEAGQHLIPDGAGVLTHCNAGGLATAEYGTALAVMYVAHRRGRRFRVYADETRPLLQGARLTAWELQQAGIDVTVICDNMAGLVMKEGKVQVVITGADRIAANGDAANKIGTYSLAVLAKAHGIPFYVAAPRSSFDLTLADGSGIPIEQRSDLEVRRGFGKTTVPEGVPCYCPAFDVTPASLISGLITDRGLIQPVSTKRIASILESKVATPEA